MSDPLHPELDALLDGFLDEHLRLDVAAPLHPASQRLMDFLGVEVVVTDLAELTNCPHLTCTWNFVGDPEKARPYLEAHLRLMHGAKQPEQSPVSVAKTNGHLAGNRGGRSKIWTPELVVAAIQRWNAEHGKPPAQSDWMRRGEWWPTFSTAARCFGGSWRAAIEAAGLQPQRSAPKQPARGEDNAGSRERREQRAAESASAATFGLTLEQLRAAGAVMEAVASRLQHLERGDRRRVWAFVRPLIDEGLA